MKNLELKKEIDKLVDCIVKKYEKREGKSETLLNLINGIEVYRCEWKGYQSFGLKEEVLNKMIEDAIPYEVVNIEFIYSVVRIEIKLTKERREEKDQVLSEFYKLAMKDG